MLTIPTDKLLHFGAAYFITTSVGKISGSWLIGAGAAAVASVGKEVYDWKSYGHFCHWDLLADLLGIIAGVGVLLINKD